MRLTAIIFALTLLLVACGQTAPAVQEEDTAVQEEDTVAQEEDTAAFTPPATVDISPQELATWLEQPEAPFVLDVREPFEAEIASIPGTSALIPVGQLSSRLDELDPEQEIVVYCRSGNRSQQALQVLQDAGFTNVHNLSGGISGWSSEVDPSVPTY